MSRDATSYNVTLEYPQTLDELRHLNWRHQPEQAIDDAAALVEEILRDAGVDHALDAVQETIPEAFQEPVVYLVQERMDQQAAATGDRQTVTSTNADSDTAATQHTDWLVVDTTNDTSALDYRYTYLAFQYDDGGRSQWIAENVQYADRPNLAGDCVTRALAVLRGPENYGRIWESITQSIQETNHPLRTQEPDADHGANITEYLETFRDEGLKWIHTKTKGTALDLREIPNAIGHLFNDENPLNYIGLSQMHAVAVVEGVVHDTYDSRVMTDTRDVFVQCDNIELQNKAQAALKQYLDDKKEEPNDVKTVSRR